MRTLIAGAIAALLLCATGLVPAQTPDQVRRLQTLTPEQIQQLKSLTPEQRAALLDSEDAHHQVNGEAFEDEVRRPRRRTPQRAADTGPSPIEKRFAGATAVTTLDISQSVRAIQGELKQFGYELFSGAETLTPSTDIPVPDDYLIGPGDTVELQLFGKENRNYSLTVTREGQLNLPEIGPVNVAGLRFERLREDIEQRVATQMIGVNASVTMGRLRSIRVFILGDVVQPGSYTVSALSTMTNALFAGGGISRIGSLRDIRLKRRGKLVTRLDIYDLLIHGNTSRDARLQSGDVIFVPTIGETAAVAGEVRRPAIYELRKGERLADLLQYAGGLLPTAHAAAAQLDRINAKGERSVLDLDLGRDTARKMPLVSGDLVRVYSVLDKIDDIVLLAGHLKRPGGAQWREGMRLTDAIGSVDQLLPRPDLDYVVIRRETGPERRVEAFSTSLRAALADPGSPADIPLQPRDKIYLFSSEDQAASLVDGAPSPTRCEPDELKRKDELMRGEYEPREPSARHEASRKNDRPTRSFRERDEAKDNERDAVAAASGRAQPRARIHPTHGAAARDRRVIADETEPRERRDEFDDTDRDDDDRKQGRIGEDTDSACIVRAQNRQNLLAELIESLETQAASGKPAQLVRVVGLVRQPGAYPLDPQMRISSLVRAGGGLQESAYTLDAEITRHEVGAGRERMIAHIPVDLSAVLQGDAAADLELSAHDILNIKLVPAWSQQSVVEIRGEVQFPGSYPIKQGERLSEVIGRAGGLTRFAYPQGAVFVREDLKAKEQERIDALARQMESDIAAVSLEQLQNDPSQAQSLASARSLLTQLQDTKATGRLVIDLAALEGARASEADVILKDGDMLVVPGQTQEVTVLGEVQYPTSHLLRRELSVNDYINLSGGLTFKADSGRTYVIRADGRVEPTGSGWLGRSAEVYPGDTIVVPLDVDRVKPITLLTNISQIIYQLAITVAAAKTVGVF